MAIVESRRRRKIPPPSATTEAAGDSDSQAVRGNHSESDAIKWKTKAKQRKEEIIRLKEDLKIAEGKSSSCSYLSVFASVNGLHHDVFPQSVSCKCYFFDNLGNLSPKHESEQKRFGDVLRRRFLRQVRFSERKRSRLDGAVGQYCISDSDIENGMEQLRASVDFLVELCEKSSPNGAAEGSFRNWSHQAVDFILATLKTLSSGGKKVDMVESIISSLIVRLMRRMCNGSQGDELVQDHCDFQFYIQHLLRKLGTDPYVGQRLILSVSQRISIVAESLLVMDPFDGAFFKMHNGMYLMIQLIEFLISDCLLSWSTRQDFDTKLLEEWIVSVFSARKALELLETRNTLYVLYMDRVIGGLTRHLGQTSLKDKLRPNTLEKLFS
ncbi:multipolar spindle 1 [Striga hermonthica]|uniref:Multipolar spindle 1 n=1 Tax=Striga hermonthica TaxID=68872 RepID=A0A9N7MTT9_STRHE|nr:multipolar spindle 1 [Striga hermonthica]